MAKTTNKTTKTDTPPTAADIIEDNASTAITTTVADTDNHSMGPSKEQSFLHGENVTKDIFEYLKTRHGIYRPDPVNGPVQEEYARQWDAGIETINEVIKNLAWYSDAAKWDLIETKKIIGEGEE